MLSLFKFCDNLMTKIKRIKKEDRTKRARFILLNRKHARKNTAFAELAGDF